MKVMDGSSRDRSVGGDGSQSMEESDLQENSGDVLGGN